MPESVAWSPPEVVRGQVCSVLHVRLHRGNRRVAGRGEDDDGSRGGGRLAAALFFALSNMYHLYQWHRSKYTHWASRDFPLASKQMFCSKEASGDINSLAGYNGCSLAYLHM